MTLSYADLYKAKLPRPFFLNNTVEVAHQLLGKSIVVRHGNTLKTGVINETEAYRGTEDLACHASHGKTQRNAMMWEEGGHLYVYFIYGVYHCANIVTEEKGCPSAVLIRGVIPLFETQQKTDGPGKFCRTFEIKRKENGVDITTDKNIFISDVGISPISITSTPRIGVSYAKEWAKKPWRFIAHFKNDLLKRE